jgi:hypothetical protein
VIAMKKTNRADRQKITVKVPADLLARARKISQTGISDAVRQGLEILAAQWARAAASQKEAILRLNWGN